MSPFQIAQLAEEPLEGKKALKKHCESRQGHNLG